MKEINEAYENLRDEEKRKIYNNQDEESEEVSSDENKDEISKLEADLFLAAQVGKALNEENTRLKNEINILKEKLEEKLATAEKIVDREKYDSLYED
jgi:DnaJ-class molecular chaperone